MIEYTLTYQKQIKRFFLNIGFWLNSFWIFCFCSSVKWEKSFKTDLFININLEIEFFQSLKERFVIFYCILQSGWIFSLVESSLLDRIEIVVKNCFSVWLENLRPHTHLYSFWFILVFGPFNASVGNRRNILSGAMRQPQTESQTQFLHLLHQLGMDHCWSWSWSWRELADDVSLY